MRQNWLEWGALAASVIAVVAVVGFLVVDGISDEGRPPTPVVELLDAEAYMTEHGWILPAQLTNDGDTAAEALVIRATATVEGTEEESEISVDYLPAGTAVEVSFGFSAEPEGEVTVQVVGFRLP
jgi:uncharacterized protein (TIGR02588 family)